MDSSKDRVKFLDGIQNDWERLKGYHSHTDLLCLQRN